MDADPDPRQHVGTSRGGEQICNTYDYPFTIKGTLGLWTRFQLKLNIFFLCRPKVLHGDHPTVQVMLRHLGGGDRASLCGCPTLLVARTMEKGIPNGDPNISLLEK